MRRVVPSRAATTIRSPSGSVVKVVLSRALHLRDVTAGRAQVAAEPGVDLDYLERGNDNRRAASLYLSIMDRMGVKLDRFGDSDQRLADL